MTAVPARRSAWRHGATAFLAGVMVWTGTAAVAADDATVTSASPSPEPVVAVAASPEPTASPTASPTAEPSAEPSPSPSPADASSPDATAPTAAPSLARAATTAASIATGFIDVTSVPGTATYSPFAAEIAWLAGEGISEGWSTSTGAQFRPLEPVRRDTMAAFLHRLTDSPVTTMPVVSPFGDVTLKSNVFYPEITWLAQTGVSTGWSTAKGAEYRPYQPIAREEIAAFLYRLAGSPSFSMPSTLPFTDIAGSAFTKEIAWLESTGVTEGWQTSTGTQFRPRADITREAMAAFLFRLSEKGLAPTLTSAVALRHSTLYVYDANLNFRTGPATSYAKVVTLAAGTAVKPTGTTKDGWIEVTYNGQKLWGSSKYLVGRNGAAGARITSSYSNGKLPASELCILSWDHVETLECSAAYDLELLNREFLAAWGYNIPLNDTYRDYDTQVEFKKIYGNLAATPGTSNHGWGLAIDASVNTMGGETSATYLWLTQRLGAYNWVHPAWARTTGSKPEAWHFEFTG